MSLAPQFRLEQYYGTAGPTADTTGAIMYHRLRREDDRAPAIMYFAGGGGQPTPTEFVHAASESILAAPLRASVQSLVVEGFVVLCVGLNSAPHTWGNAASITLVNGWATWLLNTFPLTRGGTRLATLGLSMGNITQFNWAVRNLSIINGCASVNGSVNLVYQYHGGIQGNGLDGFHPNEINTAFGLPAGPPNSNNSPTLNATVKAERDPTTRAGELNGIVPYHVFQNQDDLVVDAPVSVPAFVSAVGATATYKPTGGHFIWDIDNTVLVDFMEDLDWT